MREVIRHGDNGWLVDFFDGEALVECTLQALAGSQQGIELRERARRGAQDYSISKGIQGYLQEVERLLGRRVVSSEISRVVEAF
ncbi:hypothetical protein [Stutzerimonas kirkiae]|uniref:hypothetical protein n=1 Tax=Stutzerimonas kirkiae TaxID=2211392 RepID=UPI001038338A|nr:hypothetical protein [Stutzerimonas kirkiae]TBV13667.1 hypothetical protein DNK01_10790 [Stutzerimonas kirkiae]